MKYLMCFLLFFFSINAQSYENFDECSEFQKIYEEKVNSLSLDELEIKTYNNKGIELGYIEKEKLYYVMKIEPILIEEFYKKKLNFSVGDIVESINGNNISGIDNESFNQIWNIETKKDILSIKTFINDKPINFQNRNFYSANVFISIEINEIKNINSKESEINTSFNIIKTWYDTRLSRLGKLVHEKALRFDPEAKDYSFYCNITNDFKLNRLEIPSINVENFLPTIPNRILSTHIEYYPEIICEDTECDDVEKEYGIIEIKQKINYTGTISQDFDFSNFPYDQQNINFDISSKDIVRPFEEDGETNYKYTNLIFPEIGYDYLDIAKSNLYSSSWKFKDYNFSYGNFYEPKNQIRVPFLNLYLEIERNTSYYLYKIILPIIFILLITFSVFWISIKEIETRVTITIVSLLTLIAYNFVIDQDVPKLGIITYLDKFIIISYIFAGLPTLITVAVSNFASKKKNILSKKIDNYSKIFLPLSFLFVWILISIIQFY